VRSAARAYITHTLLHALALHRLHVRRFHEQGVDQKRRPPKSLSDRTSTPDKPKRGQAQDQRRSPQGLRRPRFSFFQFTCQTAREQACSPTQWQAKGPSKHQSSRQQSEALSHWSVRSFEGASSRRQAGGDAVCRYIGFARGRCQHIQIQKYGFIAFLRQSVNDVRADRFRSLPVATLNLNSSI